MLEKSKKNISNTYACIVSSHGKFVGGRARAKC